MVTKIKQLGRLTPLVSRRLADLLCTPEIGGGKDRNLWGLLSTRVSNLKETSSSQGLYN